MTQREVAHPNLQPTCNQLATDTISRQAAIDALRQQFKKSPTTAIRAMNTIEELPSAHPEQCWIPVSERLPEENGMYIVTIESRSDSGKKRFISIAVRTSMGWMNGENVVAWQPLQAPYKGKKE